MPVIGPRPSKVTHMIGRINESFQFHSASLRLRGERQQILAANIANADTPGYKAVDFDFAGAMRAASGAQPGTAAANGPSGGLMRVAATPAQTARGHLAGLPSAYAGISTQYRLPAQPAADGNSVDMDLERARFAENSIRYEAALRFLNGQIKTLMSAIQG